MQNSRVSTFLMLLGTLVCVAAFAPAQAKAAKPFNMAITVDDLPPGAGSFKSGERLEATKKMIQIFKAHGISKVTGFVNTINVDEDQEGQALLKEWLAAGFELSNHTYAHTGAHRQSAADFIREIELTDAFLAGLGISRYERRAVRFPFLAEGDTLEKRNEIRAYFKKNGYRVAPITMDSNDWRTEELYEKTKPGTPERAQVIQDGVQLALKGLTGGRRLAKEVVGREMSHIFLMHLTAVNSEMLDQVLTEYEARGAQVISLDEALQDPVYKIDHGQASPGMGSFLEEMAYAKGMWTPDMSEQRESQYRPSTIQKRLARVPGVCSALF